MANRPSQVRCFIAIELSEQARTELTLLQDRLKAVFPSNPVRWTCPTNIHLTLHFLGDVSADLLETVSQTVRDVAAPHSPFSLTLSGLGCFPNTRRPRILWVAVSGETERLVSLQRELGTQLEQRIGFQPDSRPYSPHLTIGRVRKGMAPHRLNQMGQRLEQEMPTVGELAVLPVEHVHFIRSDLTPGGPLYTPLAQGVLKG